MTLLEKILQSFRSYDLEITRQTNSLTHVNLTLTHGTLSAYLFSPYLGVAIVYLMTDVSDDEIPALSIPNTLSVAYCLSGNYSVENQGNYISRLSANTFNINLHPQSKYRIRFDGPMSVVTVVYDMEILRYNYPQTFRELDIRIEPFSRHVAAHGNHIAVYGDGVCLQEVEEVIIALRKSGISLPRLRFALLQYMITIQDHIDLDTVLKPVRLTPRCQRIVLQTEYLLTQDLTKRALIPDIAKELDVSPATLKRCFSMAHGKSIGAYLKDERIRQAKIMLASTDRSIDDIAKSVGYENQSKFAQLFKKMTDQTPTEYRKNCQHEWPDELGPTRPA